MRRSVAVASHLVAGIAAAAVESVEYAAIKRWDLQDPVTRLRCIAACGDPAAVAALEAEFRQIAEQEQHWAESDRLRYLQSADSVKDTYERGSAGRLSPMPCSAAASGTRKPCTSSAAGRWSFPTTPGGSGG